MTAGVYTIVGLAFVFSVLLTGWVRQAALLHGVIDHPNARSSHTRPTPRGGGLAIVAATSISVGTLWYAGILEQALSIVMIGGGGTVALLGFLDDRGHLTVRIRMVVHVLAAGFALYMLGGLPALPWGEVFVDLGLFGDGLALIGIVWVLNLYNFMDGIDGIAASEAVFICLGAALLGAGLGGITQVGITSLIVAAATLGFLLWNWPPAKIFMGDGGSGYLGYVISVLAIADAHENAIALFVWLILGGVFFVDATVTLVRRLVRRERVYEAHRSHGYQWLVRRWNSHERVTVAVLIVNLLWLFPCALIITLDSHATRWILAVALIPIAIVAVAAGAGKREVNIDGP